METEWRNGIEGIILNSGLWVPIFKGGSDTDTIVQGEDTDDDEDDWDDDEDDDDFDDDDDDDDLEESLSEGFLRDVPEEHREILAPYIKKWDAGVTRRFQELHSQYAPYKELGELEELQQTLEVVQYLRENPEELYELLKEEYGEQGQPEPVPSGTPNLQGLPPEFMDQFGQVRSVVEMLADQYLQQQSQTQEQAEDEELENYLGLLKEEFGDFDEAWVLTKMAGGMDGERAVKSFMRFRQKLINEALESQEDVPHILSGGGSAPSGDGKPQKLGDIPKKDLQQFVVGLLDQTSSANQ